MTAPKSTELYLTYEEHYSGGGIRAGEEDSAWPDYEDEYVHFSPQRAYLNSDEVPNYRPEQFKALGAFKPGDSVHLVIVRYSDGGTFQTTRGYWKIYGAFKDAEKAVALVKEIEGDARPDYSNPRQVKYGPASWAGRPGVLEDYRCWDGYFSGFESVDVHSVVVF